MLQHNPPNGPSPASVQFPLGQLVATPGAIRAMANAGDDPAALLARHRRGDWGTVDPDDAAANDRAVTAGERLLSAYALGDGVVVWVITEADRSSTCMLTPGEY